MRPVFVGDVQGCGTELEELLVRVEERLGADFELWTVGDLINRGPRNRAALSQVRDRLEQGRARAVLGNHELSFLSVCLGLRPVKFSDSLGELLEAPDRDDWFEWLRRLPLVETGRLGERRFAMVHAAVHPDWSLEELVERAGAAQARLADPDRDALRRFLAADPAEDPDREVLGRLTSCRSVGPDAAWSKLEPEAPRMAWHESWCAREHDYAVVYGHWSLQGLHVAPGLRGLDTGCVHHGRDHDGYLTAWMPDPAERDPFCVPDDRFLQVRARERYFREPPNTDQ